jgi:hypothetical protein
MNRSIQIKLITGAVTLVYCLVPIMQDKAFSSFSDRFNNLYFFFISSGVYGFMQLLYTNSSIVYVVQLVLWLFLWWISYLSVRFLA